MSYVNFVQVQLDQPAAATDTTLYIRDAVAPYNLPPEDGGVLVLADSMYKPSVLEVVRYTSRTGLVLNGVERGREGSTAADWSAGSFCYMAITGGSLGAQEASFKSLESKLLLELLPLIYAGL